MEGEEVEEEYKEKNGNGCSDSEWEEQQQIIVALIPHRTKQVEKNLWRLNHYNPHFFLFYSLSLLIIIIMSDFVSISVFNRLLLFCKCITKSKKGLYCLCVPFCASL